MPHLLHWRSGWQTIHWRSGYQSLCWTLSQTSDITPLCPAITACVWVSAFLDLRTHRCLPVCVAATSFWLGWLFPTAQIKRVNISGVQYFCAYKRVESNSSFHLSSFHFTSSQFLPTSLFASATARVRHPPNWAYMRVTPERRHQWHPIQYRDKAALFVSLIRTTSHISALRLPLFSLKSASDRTPVPECQ